MQVMEKAPATHSVKKQVKHWLWRVIRRMPWTMQYAIRTAVNPPGHYSKFRNVYHCTTWRTASQWLRAIFADKRIYESSGFIPFAYEATLPGGVDPRPFPQKYIRSRFPMRTIATPLYVAYEPYRDMPKPTQSSAIFVLRDPRDLVVSEYFSTRYSHALIGDVPKLRAELQALSERDGMLRMLRYLEEMGVFAAQRSWIDGAAHDATVLLVRYEDLTATDNHAVWTSVLHHFDIQMPDSALADLLREHSFEAQTGRKRGTTDLNAHLRKGIHGDWKNYFDAELVSQFKNVTGDLLLRLGYETEAGWRL
jgi:hypothetical protein